MDAGTAHAGHAQQWVADADARDRMTGRLLRQAGCGAVDLPALRAEVAAHAIAPQRAVRALVHAHRLLAIGEMHTARGRVLAAALVDAAADAGARLLCLEIHPRDQPALDAFAGDGCRQRLPAHLGGGGQSLPSDGPYLDMLDAAHRRGMRLLAVDHDGDEGERDAVIADRVLAALPAGDDARAVIVIGQMHLLRRPQSLAQRPLALHLDAALGPHAVATLGRAVPQNDPAFSLWTLAAAPTAPGVIDTRRSQMAALPAHIGPRPMRAIDFDALLLVPPSPEEQGAWSDAAVNAGARTATADGPTAS